MLLLLTDITALNTLQLDELYVFTHQHHLSTTTSALPHCHPHHGSRPQDADARKDRNRTWVTDVWEILSR